MNFEVIEEDLFNKEIGFYKAYGIVAKESSSGKIIDSVSDLFLDSYKAESFASLLQECQPEPVHFRELCLNEIE